MSIIQELLPFDISDLKYGDKVWFIISRNEPYHYQLYIQPNTWRGSSQEFQLLDRGLCFNSEEEAINKFKKIVNSINPSKNNKEKKILVQVELDISNNNENESFLLDMIQDNLNDGPLVDFNPIVKYEKY